MTRRTRHARMRAKIVPGGEPSRDRSEYEVRGHVRPFTAAPLRGLHGWSRGATRSSAATTLVDFDRAARRTLWESSRRPLNPLAVVAPVGLQNPSHKPIGCLVTEGFMR